MKTLTIIILFALLMIPSFSRAQLELEINIGSGFSKTYDKRGASPVSDELGLSFNGGFEVNYYFAKNIGIGTGVFYSYNQSTWVITVDHDRSSNAISIPLNLIYQFGLSKFGILTGASANINLNKGFNPNSISGEEYKPLYVNLQVGCFYKINKNFKLGLIAETGITPYYEKKILNAAPEYGTFIDKFFLSSINLKLSYTLFRK